MYDRQGRNDHDSQVVVVDFSVSAAHRILWSLGHMNQSGNIVSTLMLLVGNIAVGRQLMPLSQRGRRQGVVDSRLFWRGLCFVQIRQRHQSLIESRPENERRWNRQLRTASC